MFGSFHDLTSIRVKAVLRHGPVPAIWARTGQDRVGAILLHPDYTVGPGVTPDLLTPAHPEGQRKALAGYTAGGELHPALRTPDQLPGATGLAGRAGSASGKLGLFRTGSVL